MTSHAQTKVYQDLLLVGRVHGGFERDFVTVVVLSRVVPLMGKYPVERTLTV